jgi:hypothetical protein
MPDVFLTGGKDREMSKCERWLSLIITAINERPLVTPLPFNQALCRPALATLVLLDEVILYSWLQSPKEFRLDARAARVTIFYSG